MREKTITIAIDSQGNSTLDLEGFAGKHTSPPATRHAGTGWTAYRHAPLEFRGLKADIHHGPESQTQPKAEYLGADHLPFLVFRSQLRGEPYIPIS
jgi:hypothetical protein